MTPKTESLAQEIAEKLSGNGGKSYNWLRLERKTAAEDFKEVERIISQAIAPLERELGRLRQYAIDADAIIAKVRGERDGWETAYQEERRLLLNRVGAAETALRERDRDVQELRELLDEAARDPIDDNVEWHQKASKLLGKLADKLRTGGAQPAQERE